MVTARRKDRDKPAARVSALLGLQKVELFKGLDTASLREIAQQCTWTRCKRNAVVIRRDGTGRSEVTREFSRLARQGLIERQRRRALVLRDVAALERLAGAAAAEHAPASAAPAEELRDIATWGAQRLRRAVLVADVIDAAGLMERDEERTLGRWRTFFAHATAEIIPTHAGRSLSRTLSDGFLAEFTEASLAVRCALELHQELARSNASSNAQPLGLRIGIHVADVIVETFNVLGDGVNVAARLAELANAGETIVSAAVRDQLTSGVDPSVEDLGEQRLRNRSRTERAFRLWPAAHADAATPSAAVRAHGRPSLAVIPFQVRSDDMRLAFIGDGLADETIAVLSRVPDFFVSSRLSTMAFRRAPLGVRTIGEMLGVQYVLSGSVQTAEAQALLMAELADTRDGRIVWSERFEGDLADMFAMQGELARKVVQSVTPVVRSIELRRARITSFDELDAYGMTLRGVELMHRQS